MILSISWKNVWRNKTRSMVVIVAVMLGIFGGVMATGIMNVLRSKLAEFVPCRLTALQLSLGELSGIDRDSLRFALDTLLADADHNGVEIRFEFTPATFKCSACSWQGR